jgi:hypothetical protein
MFLDFEIPQQKLSPTYDNIFQFYFLHFFSKIDKRRTIE